jgi:hypothetical protein
MDFVVGLPRTPRGKDAIWVVVDRLTKLAHFIPMKTTNLTEELVPLYMKEVLTLHEIECFSVALNIFGGLFGSPKIYSHFRWLTLSRRKSLGRQK